MSFNQNFVNIYILSPFLIKFFWIIAQTLSEIIIMWPASIKKCGMWPAGQNSCPTLLWTKNLCLNTQQKNVINFSFNCFGVDNVITENVICQKILSVIKSSICKIWLVKCKSKFGQCYHLDIQWILLNGITLGQTITDPINLMIPISKWASTYFRHDRVIWDL